MLRKIVISAFLVSLLVLSSCEESQQVNQGEAMKSQTDEKYTLVTLDPGHFHAALVQKSMYPQLNKEVYVFAPAGPDVADHLQKIESFNNRQDNPTDWK